MKKLIVLCALVLTFSCGKTNKDDQESVFEKLSLVDKTPKCDDPDVIETVRTIMLNNSLVDTSAVSTKPFSLKSIVTNEVDDKLKACGCEAILDNENNYDDGKTIYYNVKTDSKGEKVISVLPF